MFPHTEHDENRLDETLGDVRQSDDARARNEALLEEYSVVDGPSEPA